MCASEQISDLAGHMMIYESRAN